MRISPSMHRPYSEDREFSDRFIPTIKSIVGPLLLEEAPLEVDLTQATDLVILRARDLMIGARVRRPGYAAKYPHQFTVRSKRERGGKTELAKLIDGWGDWLFYGHAVTEDRLGISPWWIIDLDAWRAHLIRDSQGYHWLGGEMPNGDGTWFWWYDLRTFNPPIHVAASDAVPRRLVQ